jgi:hypothetical protein
MMRTAAVCSGRNRHCAEVEHVRVAVHVGSGAQMAAVDTRQHFQDEARDRHQGPVLPARDAGIRLAGLDELIATRIDESFLLRRASAGDSSMPTTSEACTMRSGNRGGSTEQGRKTSSDQTGEDLPPDALRENDGRGTVTDGPWSPPMQSMAMRFVMAKKRQASEEPPALTSDYSPCP